MSDCPVEITEQDRKKFLKRRDKEYNKLLRLSAKELENILRKEVKGSYKSCLTRMILETRGW